MPIYWSSKKQTIITLSSGDAKYLALSATAKNFTLIWNLYLQVLNKKHYNDTDILTLLIYIHITKAMFMTAKDHSTERRKQIDNKIQYVLELIQKYVLILQRIWICHQPTDILTNGQINEQLNWCIRLVRFNNFTDTKVHTRFTKKVILFGGCTVGMLFRRYTFLYFCTFMWWYEGSDIELWSLRSFSGSWSFNLDPVK